MHRSVESCGIPFNGSFIGDSQLNEVKDSHELPSMLSESNHG